MTQEQNELWLARCKAWDAAHKHQWREPWASRHAAAVAAYDKVSAEVDAAALLDAKEEESHETNTGPTSGL